MSFLSLSKKYNKEKIIAIFDIGSGSVGGALVKISKNKNPLVIFSIRNDINFHKELNYEDFVNSMSITLKKTAENLLNKKIIAPSGIFCVLSSPWYTSENRVINSNKNKRFVFTEKMASKLLDNEIREILNSHKVKYSDPFDLSNVPDIIEKHVLSVSLDGKNIVYPVGKKYTNLSMNLIVSFSTRFCISKIKEALNTVFHHEKINFLSFASATHLVLRDKYIGENSYLLLDVAGEITDISLIEDGLLRNTASFPFGRKTILKYVSNSLNIDLREALSLLKLYNKGNLFSSHKELITPIIEKVRTEWHNYFNNAVSSIGSSLSIIPRNIFVTSDDDIKDFIIAILNNTENYNILHNNPRYHVNSIESGDLLSVCDFACGYHDPFIMIDAVAINKKINQSK